MASVGRYQRDAGMSCDHKRRVTIGATTAEEEVVRRCDDVSIGREEIADSLFFLKKKEHDMWQNLVHLIHLTGHIQRKSGCLWRFKVTQS
ncbi:hypothetical protein A2U01_0015586 [Trifolium medium]|uniref:Uncharacterized protein n=1 Tax=Trifolium medium TaxID=97028 RepID=A0A392N4W8_9FABA|nr:hypothetical protein [Trifolium medium]